MLTRYFEKRKRNKKVINLFILFQSVFFTVQRARFFVPTSTVDEAVSVMIFWITDTNPEHSDAVFIKLTVHSI